MIRIIRNVIRSRKRRDRAALKSYTAIMDRITLEAIREACSILNSGK